MGIHAENPTSPHGEPFEHPMAAGSAVTPERRQDAHKTVALLRAIEQTADSVFITDRHGTIIYGNPAFEELTGYKAAEALGATPRLFKSGHYDQAFYDRLWKTILSGQVFRHTFVNRARDGRLYDEDQTITPIRDAQGAITHFVTCGRDMTQRRRTEEALRRLQNQLELESARIAGVLHDEAGQFLTSAHIALAEATRQAPAALQAPLGEVRQHLDQVESQLRRVSHELHPSIIDDLGWLEAIKFIANAFGRRNGIPVTIRGGLESACAACREAGGPTCPKPITTVVYRFVQEALNNIGKHARASSVEIRIACDRERLQCSVRDNGVGFEIDGPTVPTPERGLGLTMIRDRLEAIGGTLEIESAPGEGTYLHTVIPVEN